MAAANPAENLRKEASCAICLDYFTDPVTIDCGHNFCRSCISGSWEGTGTDFPCPQCREWSRHRTSIRPNRQLANVIETARKLSQGSAGRKKCNVCEKHEEKLKLFCREDQRVICVVCKRSRDHASHTVIPVKRLHRDTRAETGILQKANKPLCLSLSTLTISQQKIEKCLRPLRKDLEYLLQFKSEEEKKAEELRSGTEIMRQKIVSDFEDLYQFLNKKKQSLLSKLEEEEKKALRKIRENVMRVEEQSSSLMQFISETEEKCQQKAIRLLKDIKGILSRCQKRRIPKPVVVSTEVETCFSLSYRHELNKCLQNLENTGWKVTDTQFSRCVSKLT
ncbi:E3 ubiquitin-protein ligase TRIM39 [Microcaecilia unicolor]|uniref:E3 ubiquitin-protein ligase TRIM39-like n=1 Tax=Microcaecilia unicolor TaxID=1415580 RepID=A0A6P7XJX4_9AMPH|nr:E3 ubiquitin-protein ligase TRIM39-like [Microcaecilia unicolor]